MAARGKGRTKGEGGIEPPGESSSMLGPWVGANTLHSYLHYVKPSPRTAYMPGTAPVTLSTTVKKPDLHLSLGEHSHTSHSLGQRL